MYIKNIDLLEACKKLPAFMQGKDETPEVKGLPIQVAENFMINLGYIVELFFPEVLLFPPETFNPDITPALPDYPSDWNEDMAYADIQHTKHQLEDLIDSGLYEVWEYLRYALQSRCTYTKSASQDACEELQIFKATEDIFGNLHSANEDDYWLLSFLLLYQYDTLSGLIRDNLTNEALYVFEDIAEIRCEMGMRNVKKWSKGWHIKQTSEEAKTRALIRHEKTNAQKKSILTEWDSTHTEYKSRSDFSRIISRRDGLKERTVYTWISEHEKTKL